jgi:hypothetical protein
VSNCVFTLFCCCCVDSRAQSNSDSDSFFPQENNVAYTMVRGMLGMMDFALSSLLATINILIVVFSEATSLDVSESKRLLAFRGRLIIMLRAMISYLYQLLRVGNVHGS